MTEDDAKTKWCPMARTLYAVGTPGGQIFAAANVFLPKPGEETRSNCIGSACMMWRWDVVPEQVGGGKNWDGHCGLAPIRGPVVASVPSIPTAIMRGKMGEPIGKGVYSNPQPGDADHGK